MRRLAVTLALVLLAGAGAGSAAEPGDLAPEASGVVVNGPERMRLSALPGRVRVVEFWASWCGPCAQAMPRLDRLHREVRAAGFGDRFEVLAVGLDRRVDDVRRFLRAWPVGFPVVVDAIGFAARDYGVQRLPATYLVDREGRIRQIYQGYSTHFSEDLRQRVFGLLQKPVAAVQASEHTGNP